jgi:hypothetical protein
MIDSTAKLQKGKMLETCPFHQQAGSRCLASLSCVCIGSEWAMRLCSTDDYDRCPLYVSRIMRRG